MQQPRYTKVMQKKDVRDKLLWIQFYKYCSKTELLMLGVGISGTLLCALAHPVAAYVFKLLFESFNPYLEGIEVWSKFTWPEKKCRLWPLCS